jgi:hypothetical protein
VPPREDSATTPHRYWQAHDDARGRIPKHRARVLNSATPRGHGARRLSWLTRECDHGRRLGTRQEHRRGVVRLVSHLPLAWAPSSCWCSVTGGAQRMLRLGCGIVPLRGAARWGHDELWGRPLAVVCVVGVILFRRRGSREHNYPQYARGGNHPSPSLPARGIAEQRARLLGVEVDPPLATCASPCQLRIRLRRTQDHQGRRRLHLNAGRRVSSSIPGGTASGDGTSCGTLRFVGPMSKLCARAETPSGFVYRTVSMPARMRSISARNCSRSSCSGSCATALA